MLNITKRIYSLDITDITIESFRRDTPISSRACCLKPWWNTAMTRYPWVSYVIKPLSGIKHQTVGNTFLNFNDNICLTDNMWKIREYFQFSLFLRRDWEAISKTRALGFIRVWRPLTISLFKWARSFWLISLFVHCPLISKHHSQESPNAVVGTRYPNAVIWLVRDTYPYAAIW